MIPSSTIVGRFGSSKNTQTGERKQIIPENIFHYLRFIFQKLPPHERMQSEKKSWIKREYSGIYVCFLLNRPLFLSTKYLQVYVTQLLFSTPLSKPSKSWIEFHLKRVLLLCCVFTFWFRVIFCVPFSFLLRRNVNSFRRRENMFARSECMHARREG